MGVEVEAEGALLRSALASASLSVEVVESWLIALSVAALALARFEVELLSLWALSWRAAAFAQIVVEVWRINWAVGTHVAFAFARSNVPGVTCVTRLWLALAGARITIPEVLLFTEGISWAILIVDTNALAGVVVPDKVVKAVPLLADAVTSGHIEDLVLAWAVLR